MNLCICGKSNKKTIDFSEEDIKLIWIVIGVLIIISGAISILLALALALLVGFAFAVATAIMMLKGHTKKCSMRWASLMFARVLQYF